MSAIQVERSERDIPDTEQALLGRDFVSETPANLGRRKGHATIVELEQTGKVDKVALGSLGPQVALDLTGGTNVGFKHQVELDGCGQLVAGRRLDVVLLDELAELGAGEVVNLYCQCTSLI
jgi:hypothetical protein